MLQPPPWSEISNEDLVRELDHMHQTRHDIFRTGRAEAWRNHLERTAQLEAEYLRRFPHGVTDAADKLQLYPVGTTAGG
ncbi:MAG TPA: DUF6158 family protein [Geodermatophilus sp.]|nr:DUF6158 family protein [Geodermatophilus sp.]